MARSWLQEETPFVGYLAVWLAGPTARSYMTQLQGPGAIRATSTLAAVVTRRHCSRMARCWSRAVSTELINLLEAQSYMTRPAGHGALPATSTFSALVIRR